MNRQIENEIIIDVLGDLSSAWYDGSITELVQTAQTMNDLLGDVDYRVVNLENPVCDDSFSPIIKDGPNLVASKQTTEVIIHGLEIDAFSLANNHIGDYGVEGIESTENFLTNHNKAFFGIEESEGEYTAHFASINNKIVTFLAACENEYGTARKGKKGSAGYQEGKFLSAISQTRKRADYVIVLFHGGVEHYPFPTPEQQARYRQFVDFGADIVIGSHTHCPQGVEEYKGKSIVYSIGNFWFPRKTLIVFQTWEIGYVARIHFRKEIYVECIPFFSGCDGKEFKLLDRQCFEGYLKSISYSIENDKLSNLFDEWCQMNRRNFIGKIQIDKQKRESCAALKNLFSCESHMEVMRNLLDPDSISVSSNSESRRIIKESMRIKELLLLKSDKECEKKNKELFLWGCNESAAQLIEELDMDLNLVAIIDKNEVKQGLEFAGIEVVSPEYAKDHSFGARFVICVREEGIDSVIAELRESNIEDERVYILDKESRYGFSCISHRQ